MIPFLSRRRVALLSGLFLLAIGNSGCGEVTESGTHVTGSAGSGSGAGGAGGAGGAAESPACNNPDASDFAELTAPPGDSFGEVVIAATDSEAAIAYLQWNDEARDVTVYLQRYALDGAPLGAPAPLHTYNECCGQLAAGDFYGRPSIATDGSRYLVCWGEAFQVGCAAVAMSSGEVSFHAIAPQSNGFSYLPHLTVEPSGFRVFYFDPDVKSQSLALDQAASPMGAAVPVPAVKAVATSSGHGVVSHEGAKLFRLGPDLAQVGNAVDLPNPVNGITALGDIVSVVGSHRETRVDASGQTTEIIIATADESHRMAVTASNGGTAVVWSSPDAILRLRLVNAANQPGPILDVGCAAVAALPAIAAVPDGFLIAATRPEGAHDVFYSDVYPRIRITHVAQP